MRRVLPISRHIPKKTYSSLVADSSALTINVTQNGPQVSASTFIRNSSTGYIGSLSVISLTGPGASSLSSSVLFLPDGWLVRFTSTSTTNPGGTLSATATVQDTVNGGGSSIPITIDLITTVVATNPVLVLHHTADDFKYQVGDPEKNPVTLPFWNGGTGTLPTPTFSAWTYSGVHSGFLLPPVVSGSTIIFGSDFHPGIVTPGASSAYVDVTAGNTVRHFITSNVNNVPAVPQLGVSPSSVVVSAQSGQNPSTTLINLINTTGPFADLGNITLSIPNGETWFAPVLSGQTITVTYSGGLTVTPPVAILRIASQNGGTWDFNITRIVSAIQVGSPPIPPLPLFCVYSSGNDEITGDPYTLPSDSIFS